MGPARLLPRNFAPGLASCLALVLALLAADGTALAGQAVSCGGAAMLGGAQLMCSHVDPDAPTQLCTFSWDLKTTNDASQIVEGSFLLPRGASNVQVYQGSGFNSQIGQPIILCQGRKGG